jgi:hypothetical protein
LATSFEHSSNLEMLFTLPAALAAREKEEAKSKSEGDAGAAATAPASSSALPAAASSSSASGAEILLGPLSPSLVETWLDHCALCFSAKKPYPPARSYFESHLKSDPMLDLNGVAVVTVTGSELEAPQKPMDRADFPTEAETAEAAKAVKPAPSTKVIAATARVFVRRMWLDGKQVTFGGVGEVGKSKRKKEGQQGAI